MINIFDIDILEHVKEIDDKLISVRSFQNSINTDRQQTEIFSGEEQSDKLCEGKLVKVYVNKYERNKKARAECIMHYGAICQVCFTDFEDTYGSIGKGYIHVHHIIPLHKVNKEYMVDPITELVPVCPNCHAMLHYKGNSDIDLTVEDLKEIVNKSRH